MKYLSFRYQEKNYCIFKAPLGYIFYSHQKKAFTQWRFWGECYEVGYGKNPVMKLTENVINAIFDFAEGRTKKINLRPNSPWYWCNVRLTFNEDDFCKTWGISEVDELKIKEIVPEMFDID